MQTSAKRSPHDLSHLIFSAGEIGRLQTLSVVPVLGGDSFQQDLVGNLKLSPLRRGLSMDAVIDVVSFYIPHRFIYSDPAKENGEQWKNFVEQGVQSSPLGVRSCPLTYSEKLNHLGMNVRRGGPINEFQSVAQWRTDGYGMIWNHYFKHPSDEDRPLVTSWLPAELTIKEGQFGYPVTHKKSIWTHKLPDERSDKEYQPEDNGNIELQDLTGAYGELHTEQERELFGARFRDIVKSMGGKTPYDGDKRPRLLNRTESWLSGYDIDGTTEESLGNHVGRVNAGVNHKVPRFAVPEHGAVWTVAVVRFPPVHNSELNYLDVGGTNYLDLMGDPSLVGNQQRKALMQSQMFDGGSSTTVQQEVPHSQWYRHHVNTVHISYEKLQGFPFLEDIPAALDYIYINPEDYENAFATTQQGHWNFQARNNVKIMRSLPTARDALMTSN